MSQECLDSKLEQQPTNLENEAFDLMLKGRSVNRLGEDFNQEAFELLSKSTKLNPHLIDAWIELTNCYQKKLDIDGSIACLENALKYCDSIGKPNKIILRKLSTCIRQQHCETQEAKIALLLRSLDLSKQALKLDLFDEENYYNLAKAYMCLFFVTECADQQLIILSKAAFVKALSLSNDNLMSRVDESHNVDEKFNSNGGEPTKPLIEQSDFLFNFASVLVYLQEFQQALEYLKSAIRIDAEWEEPKILEESLISYLKQTHLMLNDFYKNSKKLVKRYGKIIESLKNVERIEAIIELDQQRLKRSMEIKVKSVLLKELENKKEVIELPKNGEQVKDSSPTSCAIGNVVELLHLKLVSTINYNQAMYLTFIAMDQDYSIVVLTIYNLAASRCPTLRDVVTVVEPKLEEIKVDNSFNIVSKDSSASISYKRINIREFRSLYVNGYRITTDQVSKPQFKISVLP